MTTHKLVTVVTEAAIESALLRELDGAGVVGWTVSDARGRGRRGRRSGAWDASGNIRVEMVCDEALASTIIERIRGRFGRDYALFIFVADVTVP